MGRNRSYFTKKKKKSRHYNANHDQQNLIEDLKFKKKIELFYWDGINVEMTNTHINWRQGQDYIWFNRLWCFVKYTPQNR